MHPLRAPFRIAACAALLSLAACTTSSVHVDDSESPEGWLLPSPLLEQQIEDEARRLPYTHGIEHLEQIRWFASVGEPAYPMLLELAADEREKVAAAALASLGATGDRRLVDHVREIEWPNGAPAEESLQLEYSRTLVRLGDWSEIPVLIEGLLDERMHIRALCDQALFEATNLRFGYDPRGEARNRENSVRRWEEWWLARTGEGLLLSERG